MSTRPRTTSARWLLGAALVAALATGAVLAGAGGGHVPDGWSAHGLGDGGQLAVPDHWQVVDGGPSAGAEDPCASAAEGVLVVEASLVDRCGAHAAEPTRAIASWNRPGVPAAALAEAERIEVAGHPGDHDGSAVTVGLARWGEADELAEGSEPQIARHRVDGLPADLDLDRILVEIDTVGGETTAQVLDGSTDIVERAWELELEHDGPDRRLPKDARFVERDR